mmetsp:Transcript_57686/g.135148  ORF Transcript_57686/g.135148 Transcript_57686/m.135148 type:complete len:255 (+) Transcript_57686:37-801(+)
MLVYAALLCVAYARAEQFLVQNMYVSSDCSPEMITKTHLAIAVGPCVDMGAEHAMVEIMGNSSATISFFDNPNLTCSAVPVRNETYLLNHCDNVTSTTDHLWTLETHDAYNETFFGNSDTNCSAAVDFARTEMLGYCWASEFCNHDGTCHPGSMQSLCIGGRVINSRFEPAKNCTGDPILHWAIDVDTCDNGREVSVSACQTTTTSTTAENVSVESEFNMTNTTTTGAASVSRGTSIAVIVWSTQAVLGQLIQV